MVFQTKTKQQQKPQQPQPEKQPPPVYQLRSGVLSVSIWEQNGSNGIFYRVTAQRAYKPEGEETWKHTDSFGRDDILTIAELMRGAWNWIGRREAEMKKEAR